MDICALKVEVEVIVDVIKDIDLRHLKLMLNQPLQQPGIYLFFFFLSYTMSTYYISLKNDRFVDLPYRKHFEGLNPKTTQCLHV